MHPICGFWLQITLIYKNFGIKCVIVVNFVQNVLKVVNIGLYCGFGRVISGFICEFTGILGKMCKKCGILIVGVCDVTPYAPYWDLLAK